MAYKRFSRIKSKRFRKGRRRGYSTYASVANKALSTALWLKKLINVEKKRYDTTLTNVTSFTPTISLLTGVPLGDDYNERNGRSIKAHSNSLKYKVVVNATNPTACTVRMILFNDLNTNGVLPVITDLLDTTLSADYMINHYNADNAGSRFRILLDKRFQLDPQSFQYHLGSDYQKFKHHVKFDGSGGAIADCVSGHLYLMLVSDVALTADAPSVIWENRFSYIDN